MLPRASRLTQTEFAQYFKSGSRFHTPIATVIVQSSATPRGSVVVSKKVAKRAVDRNRLRRMSYPLLRAALEEQSAVCIVIIKPACVGLSYAQMRVELASVIGRAMKSL